MAKTHDAALVARGHGSRTDVGSILVWHELGDADRVWKRVRRVRYQVDEPDLQLIDHFPIRRAGAPPRGKFRPVLACIFQAKTRAGRDAFLRLARHLIDETGFTVLHIYPIGVTKNEWTSETARRRSP